MVKRIDGKFKSVVENTALGSTYRQEFDSLYKMGRGDIHLRLKRYIEVAEEMMVPKTILLKFLNVFFRNLLYYEEITFLKRANDILKEEYNIQILISKVQALILEYKHLFW